MRNGLNFQNFDKVGKDIKDDPTFALENMNMNDFSLAAFHASQEVYSQLMEKLEGDQSARDLLLAYSHLSFCHYQVDSIVLSDIDEAKKAIAKIYSPK